MFYHGSQKLFGWFDGYGFEKTVGGFESMGFPMPKLMAALAGGAECFGGILLAIGLFTRPAAFLIFFTMMVASFKVHGDAFSAANKGMEYPLTLGLVALGLLLTGPGKIALSKLFVSGKTKTLPRLLMS
jgi:putative oxidoreductase